jgi:5'-deoxynucleotidase YfbR-like HD superfamily hydrolase
MPVDDDSIRLDTRLAGQVRRYHTWPVLREQSVAEHCWQLMRIYMSVAETDKVDKNILLHILIHDIGEHFTGDIPYPVKSLNPNLKREMDLLESRSAAAQVLHWEAFHPIYFTDADRELFKQLELMEMAEMGMGEVLLGNDHGFIIADRCLEALYEKRPCPRLCQYAILRLKMFSRQYMSISHPISIRMMSKWWNIIEWEKVHDSQRETDRRQALQD